MDKAVLEQTSDPFFTSRKSRRVGFGIPLIRQQVEVTGGHVKVLSEEQKGTVLVATFNGAHPDIQPPGDIEGCWMLLPSMNPLADLVLKCTTALGSFEIGSFEVQQALKLNDLRGNLLAPDLRRMIRNNLDNIGIGRETIDRQLFNV